jgi:hypothetical protein
MNEKLSPIQQELLQRADSIFAYIGEAAAKAADFAGQQIPDIAYQYIAYNRMYLSLVVGTAILAIIVQQTVAITWARRAIKIAKASKEWIDESWYWFMYGMTSLFVCAGSFIIIANNFKDLIMVWVAPKIFLIEHIVRIVKA